MPEQIFRQLSAQELHGMICASLPPTDTLPVLDVCRRHRHLTPRSPMQPFIDAGLIHSERLEPPKKAREHALGLTNSMLDLRTFWIRAFCDEADRNGGTAEDFAAAKRRYKPVFDKLSKLEASLGEALSLTAPMLLGPKEVHWNEPAQQFQRFFDAVVAEVNPKGAYGLSLVGPTTRFVAMALDKLGWGKPTSTALLKCLQSAALPDRCRKMPGRKRRKIE